MPFAITSIAMPSLAAERAGRNWLSDLSLRLRMYRSLLDLLPAERPGLRLADLGSGPGFFAKVASKKGFRVTAVDAREPWAFNGSPLPAGRLAGIEFVRADVRRFDVSGFDVVAVIGLLYHLTLNEQVSLLERCRDKVAVVDTEIVDPGAVSERAARRVRRVAGRLGYDGLDWEEENRPWSSSGNPYSFWHTQPSLLRLFENAGFRRVAIVEPNYRSPYGRRQWFILNALEQTA
jgi:SAM-dependent methyltransferase